MGELRSSILSSCLLERAASADSVKGLRGKRLLVSVSVLGNCNEAVGLLLRRFIEEAN